MKQELYHGKIKQYNPEKGFGFIASNGEDIFF
ncbi:MAG: cold shock domain-containing protein, partial [Acinetobacter junii]